MFTLNSLTFKSFLKEVFYAFCQVIELLFTGFKYGCLGLHVCIRKLMPVTNCAIFAILDDHCTTWI